MPESRPQTSETRNPHGTPTDSWIPSLDELGTLGPKPILEVVGIVNERRERAGKMTAEQAKFARERLAKLQENEFYRVALATSLYGYGALCVGIAVGLGALAGPVVGIGAGVWLFCYPFTTGSTKDED